MATELAACPYQSESSSHIHVPKFNIVPLIVPIGLAFGVDPLHLGVVFLANLELGYLTPPVGMNLFLASLRFKRPLLEIWRTVLRFLVIFLVWVLVIIFVPSITVGIADLINS